MGTTSNTVVDAANGGGETKGLMRSNTSNHLRSID
jgi:hypothetical protein